MRSRAAAVMLMVAAMLSAEAQTRRVERRASFYARRATATVPESFRVTGGGPITIRLTRTSRMKGQARVVFVRDADNVAVHDSGWFDVEPIKTPTVTLPAEKMTFTTWRVDIYDRMNAGPTGEFPYAMDVDISAAAAPDGTGAELRDVPSNKAYSPTTDYPFGECMLVDQPKSRREGVKLELIGKHSFPLDPVPQVLTAAGGRNLYLEATTKPPTPIEVTLFAKEAGWFRFVPVCRCTLNGAGQTAVAAIPWDRVMTPLWRAEIRSTEGSARNAPTAVRIHRDTDPERAEFEKQRANIYSHLTTSFVCTGGRTRGQTAPVKSGHVFERATAVQVTTGGQIVEADGAAIGRVLTDALAIWSAECRTCNYDAFAVVIINGMRYLRRDVFEELASTPRYGTTNPRDPSPPFALAIKQFSAPQILMSDRPPFTPISHDADPITKLCAYPGDKLPVEFQRIRAAVGCPSDAKAAADSMLRLTLLVQDGATACGDSANIVACEADRELLELNGRDYSFNTRDRILGRGRRNVDLYLVMLHEVGHWLGLDHSEGQDDIMGDTVETSRCITSADVTRLREALAAAPPSARVRRAFRWSR